MYAKELNAARAIDLTGFQAINAGSAYNAVSDKYSLIPTTRVINVLGGMGWYPVKAAEMRCRNEERKGFQKHLIRFRNTAFTNGLVNVGDVIPEIVLTNSHDGLASFHIMAGLFRLVCSNGLVVADSTFQCHKIRHMGYTDYAVRQAVTAVCDITPRITSKVKDFQEIELTKDERGVFARSALIAKYGQEDVEKRDFQIDRLLLPYRRADEKPTLWNTFNIVQEKLLNGGQFEKKATIPGYGNYRKTVKAKGVNSISESIRINQALWLLTEKMAELKK